MDWDMDDNEDEERRNPTLSVRLNHHELHRFVVVLRRAQKRNPLAKRSDVAKELMGVTNYGFVTDEDREIVRNAALTTQQLYRLDQGGTLASVLTEEAVRAEGQPVGILSSSPEADNPPPPTRSRKGKKR